MRDPFLRSFYSLSKSRDSWLQRVRENLRDMIAAAHFHASSANGAPIHLIQYERSKRPAQAQSYSMIAHGLLIGLILLIATNPPAIVNKPPIPNGPIKTFPSPGDIAKFLRSIAPSGGSGRGGDRNPIPATHGELAPRSPIQIVRPTLPLRQNPELPVPPTILDATASPIVTPVQNIGLPWMREQTNSPGPGEGHTIGSKRGNSMGDTTEGIGGESYDNGRYRPGGSTPTCAYCPDPKYTDAARESKTQGSVTMEVLVGTDGRALRIHLLRGVGMGLDERAVESVKTWKFVPARDAAHRAVEQWVTIVAVFRLF